MAGLGDLERERERWLAAACRLCDEMGAPGLAGRFA